MGRVNKVKSFVVIGIYLMLVGCTSSRVYQDPSTVFYEIEGQAEITNSKEAEDAVQVIERNLQYAQDEDMEGYLSTIVSKAHENTQSELEIFFELYDIEHTILSIEVMDQQSDQMLIRVEQQSVAVDVRPEAEQYRDHISEANHTLIIEDGQWKIAETTMTNTDFIE